MNMRCTKFIFKNTFTIIGLIIALIAAIAAIGGNMLTSVLVSSCQSSQSLWLCVVERYIEFIALVVGGVLCLVFIIPIVADLIIAFCKWIIKTYSFDSFVFQ